MFPKLSFPLQCSFFITAHPPSHISMLVITPLLHRTSAVSLVVVGNFLSSQGRRSDALRLFTRAAAAAPRYAYPHSLRGAELALLDRREEAKQAYREAVAIDPRHYRSWYV